MSALRMQHYATYLQSFDYEIRFRKSGNHANADAMSRFPLDISDPENEIEESDAVELSQIDTLPLTAAELGQVTAEDHTVQKLIQGIKHGQSVEAKDRFGVEQHEFSLQKGCLLRGIRVYVPAPLQKRVLEELHSTHFGTTRTKSLARGYCWWPGLDRDIEDMVANCADCQSVRAEPAKMNLHCWETPTAPFQRVHVDFAGPYLDTYFFIYVDAYSKWPEVQICRSITAESTVNMCREIFSKFGIPSVLVSDHGVQFTSEGFQQFLKTNGVVHKMGAPYHPATNGQAERYVQTIKQKLKALKCTKSQLNLELCNILLTYRKMIHPSTGKSPSMLLFGRQIRSRLDLLLPKNETSSKADIVVRQFLDGDRVRVRDFLSKDKWKFGRIAEKLGKLRYAVRIDDGRIWERHIDHIVGVGADLQDVSVDTPREEEFIERYEPTISAVPAVDPAATAAVPAAAIPEGEAAESSYFAVPERIPTGFEDLSFTLTGFPSFLFLVSSLSFSQCYCLALHWWRDRQSTETRCTLYTFQTGIGNALAFSGEFWNQLLGHPLTHPLVLTGAINWAGLPHRLAVGSDDIEEKEAEMSFIHFQSTCHLAMDACRSDSSCYPAFKTVMMHCDLHRCNRNACMNSLQSFYKGIHDDLSLDIAFCLCRKTPNRHDSCMIAQEKLHPACAQRPPENLSAQESSNGALFSPPPSCHAVAEMCRQDDDCRSRLEVFEQSCAVDSVTKKCAGKTSACRQAMLGILGTPLRTNCACQGSEVQQLYDCLGWQRLLWLNPCVVESQKDFHLKRLAELGLLTTTTTPTTTTMRTTRTTQAPTPPPTKPKPVYRPKPTVAQPIETNYIETPDTRPETLVHKGNELIVRTDLDLHPTELEPRGKSVHSFPEVDHQEEDHEEEDHYRHTNGNNRIPHQRPDEQVLQMLTTEAEIETVPPTTTTTTTTEPTTTPVPIRYCVVQRSQQSDQHIAEGKSRRLYMLDDAECSELCTCGAGETLSLSCHALCVPLAPCRTSLAYYSHAAPAYQAYRGRCLCYSGRFICMRPPPGEYSLPGGIFLLLGYSSTDEALLRPHTNLGVQDAVRALQQYVQQHINNETSCILTLFNITEENIILSIRLPPDSKLSNMELLRLEKDHCTKILETISHQINHQHVEMSAHRLLSIFKMAEVQVVWPEVNRATPGATRGPHSVTLLLALVASSVIPFVRWGSISSLRWSVT
nr:uncharacterized protein LOC109408875 [Aedes albopictus]